MSTLYVPSIDYKLRKYENLGLMSLRQAIIIVIYETKLTAKEILFQVKKLSLLFELTLDRIKRIIQKLAKLAVVEYVYNDLNYTLRLTKLGREEYSKIIH